MVRDPEDVFESVQGQVLEEEEKVLLSTLHPQDHPNSLGNLHITRTNSRPSRNRNRKPTADSLILLRDGIHTTLPHQPLPHLPRLPPHS